MRILYFPNNDSSLFHSFNIFSVIRFFHLTPLSGKNNNHWGWRIFENALVSTVIVQNPICATGAWKKPGI